MRCNLVPPMAAGEALLQCRRLRMPLTLTITSTRRESPGLQRSKVFETRGGTIGRTQGNDWVLPDPERYVSGNHARVEYRDGVYYLGDTSTNGVFVNGSSQPVGAGNYVALHDGDRLVIGDYEIGVGVDGGESAAGNPFDPGEPGNAGVDLSVTSPTLPPQAPARHDESPSAPEDDPFAFLDEPPLSSPAPWDSPSADSADSGGQSPPLAPPSLDQGTPLDDFFAPPSSGGEQIPEDWDMTGFSSAPAPTDPGSPAAPPPFPEPSRGLSSTPPPQEQGDPAPMEAVPAPPAPEPARGPAATGGDAVRELQWFLQGAGLGDVSIPDDYAPVLMTAVGQMFRELIQGVMEVLMARSSLKSEFRMAMTTVRPVENNPLKFSVDVEEALRALLTKQGSGYLAPADAVHEGIMDIKGHQMAMMAGMQAAFRELLARFSPEAVERAAGKGGTFGALLPAARKAKCWDVYAEQYAQIAREAEDNFQRLFGEEFARAYEEQIEQLRGTTGRKP